MRVLAIGAHPDDIEVLCSGTLARCKERGDEIFIAIATNGNVGTGDPSITREEIGRIRHEEAKASVAHLGATLIWMDFDDEWLFNNKETRTRFIDAIREARPEIMFILSENDYHPDHRIAGQIARDCRIPVSVPLVVTNYPPTPIPTVFIMDTVYGNSFQPEFYVDITSVIETKKTMLREHLSQVAWTNHVFETDITEFLATLGKYRGTQSGYEYAEGFQLLKDWPYSGDARLLP